MGAWQNIYKYGLSATDGTVLGYGILAIKHELVYNGFADGINDKLTFGNYARDRAKEFQNSVGIDADGEVGPITARYLFHKRGREVQSQYKIPNDLLLKQKTLESNNDPAAIGVVDPIDTGLMQIHLTYYPDVSVAQAIDPAFSLPWAGQKLAHDYVSVGNDWDGALAGYNIGVFYAGQWVKAGKPATGGPLLKDGTDLWARATQYVSLVHKAAA